jgi:1-phosphofructokinase family hexose kinase
MLLVVSPNLALDRILEVDGFRSCAVQRSRSVLTQPGGKGSNVARVFSQLGGDVVLIGFAGRRNAAWVREPLQSFGIQVEAIEAYEGETRTCTIVRDPLSKDHPTVVNEESRQVEEQAIDIMRRKFELWLGRASAVLVTGSLSLGLPEDFYARMIREALSRNIFTAIDATGPAMRHGFREKPSLAKANADEMVSAIGQIGRHPEEVARAIRKHNEDMPPQVIVTLGAGGAVLVTHSDVWHAKPPRISVVNPIGAGDSFAAGYLKAIMDGDNLENALRFATAVAASDVVTPEPGFINPLTIPPLLEMTGVEIFERL